MLSLKCYTREEAVILACAELHAMFEIQTVYYYIKVYSFSTRTSDVWWAACRIGNVRINKRLLRVMD